MEIRRFPSLDLPCQKSPSVKDSVFSNNMEHFYERSIKFLYSKSQRKHGELKKICKEILKTLKTEKNIRELLNNETKKYVKPFLLAIHTNKSVLVERGLDSIQKLTSYGFLLDRDYITEIIKSLCDVFLPIQEDFIRIQLIKALLHLVLNREIHGKLLRDIIRTCFNIYLVSNDVVTQKTSKAALTQILNNIFRKVEIRDVDLNEPGINDREWVKRCVDQIFLNLNKMESKFYSEYHKDGVVIFNALCRLSMKSISSKNPLELRNRVLSLELIHSVLEHSGPVFKSSSYFIEDIKRILCISLLQNSVSLIPEVFEQALLIFKSLIFNFNKPLKKEIGMFFTNCFLQILESTYSSYVHKEMVLNVLKTIFSRQQIFIDLFVNYDCSLEEVNIIEKTVYEVAECILNSKKFVRDKWMTVEQAKSIRNKALLLFEEMLKNLQSFIIKTEEIKSIKKKKVDAEKTEKSPKNKTKLQKKEENEKEKHDGNESPSLVEKKSEKVDFREGVILFNTSPSKGLKYLIQIGRLKEDPMVIANFLFIRKDELGLDLAKIGEYFGSNKQFNLDVLHSYVHAMDFHGLSFCDAFRKFLTSFRIPGEGQQIDRIVQKFAQVFMEQNAGFPYFRNNDAAYFFSYSVMLLHTDLHNPNIRFRERMSMESFVGLIKGGNDDEDYAKEFVEKVYQDIKDEEIKINLPPRTIIKKNDEDKKKDERLNYGNKQKKKKELFLHENVELLKMARKKFGQSWKSTSSGIIDHEKPQFEKTNTFRESTDSEKRIVLLTLFKVMWKSICSSTTDSLSRAKSDEVVALCINIFEMSLFIASRLQLENALNKFSEMIMNQTGLNEIKILNRKNVKSIALMVRFMKNNYNFLNTGWFFFLKCLSRLSRMKEIGKGQKIQYSFLAEQNQKNVKKKKSLEEIDFNKLSPEEREIVTDKYYQQVNHGKVFGKEVVDSGFLDSFFLVSRSFNDNSLIHFVESLCKLSGMDLNHMKDPRDFCLKKLILICVENVSFRIQIVTKRLWTLSSSHFISTSQHKNMKISMIALDALRQIMFHFFSLKEMESFTFQRRFLKPFITVLEKSQLKLTCVECIGSLMEVKLKNIRSGWRTILEFFHESSKIAETDVVKKTYFYVKLIIEKKEFLLSLLDSFATDKENVTTKQITPIGGNYLIPIILSLAQNRTNIEIAQRSVTLIERFTYKMIDTPIKKLGEKESVFSENDVDFWIPLLHGLSRLVQEKNTLEIRIISLETIYKIIKQNGKYFNTNLWSIIFKGTLLSLFDDLTISDGANDDDDDDEKYFETDWIKNTLHKSLTFLLDTYVLFNKKIHFLFPNLLDLFTKIAEKRHEHLCYIGTSCLIRIIEENSKLNFLSEEDWKLFSDKLSMIAQKRFTIEEIINPKEEKPIEGKEREELACQRLVLKVIEVVLINHNILLTDKGLKIVKKEM